jgi:hypothetical protein
MDEAMIGTITRVAIPNDDSFTLKLPRGAEFLNHSVEESDPEYDTYGSERPVIRISHPLNAEEVPIQFFMFRDGQEIPASLMSTTQHICSWTRSLFGKDEARHLFVQFDPDDNHWALSLCLGKQLAPEERNSKC